MSGPNARDDSWFARLVVAPVRENWLTIDPRSLGLFRIAFALILLTELVQRWPLIEVYYNNLGPLSNYNGIWIEPTRPRISLLHGFGHPDQVKGFFALSGLAYLALLFGYRTRMAQVITLVCASSIHLRTPALFYGGDFVVQAFLVWTVFLPLGRRYSIDALLAERRGDSPKSRHAPIRSIAVLGCVVQLAIIYIYNSLDKTGEHWVNGHGLHYALWFEPLARPVGVWLREHASEGWLMFMSYTAWYGELYGGFLLLSPWRAGWIRLLVLGVMGAMHVGIYLTLDVALFSPTMMSTYFLLVPGHAWDRVAAFARARGRALPWLESAAGGEPDTVPDDPPRLWGRRAIETLVAINLFAVVISSLSVNPGIPEERRPTLPAWTNLWLAPVSAYHKWGLFSPNPPTISVFFWVVGETADGRKIDPINGGPPHEDFSPGFTNELPPMRFNFAMEMHRNAEKLFKRDLAAFVWRSHTLEGRDPADEVVRFHAMGWVRKSPEPGKTEQPDPKTWVRFTMTRPDAQAAPAEASDE